MILVESKSWIGASARHITRVVCFGNEAHTCERCKHRFVCLTNKGKTVLGGGEISTNFWVVEAFRILVDNGIIVIKDNEWDTYINFVADVRESPTYHLSHAYVTRKKDLCFDEWLTR